MSPGVGVIDRPDTSFDGPSHTYGLEGWDPDDVHGVSTIAKVGGFDETWGIASAWGFRIGYEGAHDVLDAANPEAAARFFGSKDSLRAELKERKLTPWNKRDQAAERGTWVHDVLEVLGQNTRVPTTEEIAKYTEEAQGHIRSLLGWYVRFRPKFVATEVQIASRTHGFAGRYDIRAIIDAHRLVPLLEPPVCQVYRTDPQAERIRFLASIGEPALGLLDLKTSKGIYPETHFPQLEGYEGAGLEMNFPATDFRAVINTKPDGTFELSNFAISWATYDDFLAYLTALRAVRRIQRNDPETLFERAREAAILEALPALSRDLAAKLPELAGLDAKAVGRILGKMRKRRLVSQDERKVWHRV